jgi:hypothetical protein
MQIHMKLDGHYIGCDPGTGPQWPVYVYGQNGDTRSGPAGEWETLELTLRPGSTTQFSTLFLAADRQLSAVPASPGVPAHLETRADGAIGLWETESAVTEPDGLSLWYRDENGLVVDDFVLTIEAA